MATTAKDDATQEIKTGVVALKRNPYSILHPFYWVAQAYILFQILLGFVFAPPTPRTSLAPFQPLLFHCLRRAQERKKEKN